MVSRSVMHDELGATRRAALRFIEATRPTARRITITPAMQKLERKRIRDRVKATRTLRGHLIDFLDNLRTKVLAKSHLAPFLREADDDADAGRLHNEAIIDAAIESAMIPDPLASILRSAMQEMYASGLTSAADEIAQIVEGQEWNVDQVRALKAIDAYTIKLSKQVIDREKAALKQLVRDSIEQGTSTVDLAKAISEHFEDGLHFLNDAGTIDRVYPTDAWAEMVARTETNRAYNAGVIDLYHAADVEKIMFLAAEDERMCPECEELDGNIYPIDDAPEIPVHPMCRCCWVSVSDEKDEAA
jgi:SPP1 gp7 family putative phage head morphogenesis protein